MLRGPIYQESYKPQFSGHETFPLRHGWLKKAYEAVEKCDDIHGNNIIFLDDDAIARFGVGKNMVASMRHWATVVGIIADNPEKKSITTTDLGRHIFSSNGLDPFLEHPSTLWFIHWQLSGAPTKTTWFWTFNHYQREIFERDQICKGLERLAQEMGWSRVAATTIKRDVECFVRTYVARLADKDSYEDTIESPLAELGLIKPIGKRDGFRFIRGAKPSLGMGIFTYALIKFWNNYSQSTTLTFESIAHEPGSPGRVFLLDENEVIDRLQNIHSITNGAYQWSETAGLKQLIRSKPLPEKEVIALISLDYNK